MKPLGIKRRRTLRIAGALVLTAAVILGGLSVYGRTMLKKIPALSFEDTLNYTLKDSPEAVITVGTVKDGKASYTVYGNNAEILPPRLHDYEIGSLTKTFTAALVARAIKEERIDPEAPIDRYLSLPEGRDYPTVTDLVTHTSGFRSHYFEWPMASNSLLGKNDFYGVTREMLEKKLTKIQGSGGETFLYSNFGYATLGLILEKVYRRDYAQLMEEFLSGELGLQHTRLSDQRGSLSGYWDWNTDDAYLPAGGILSDIEDMLTYARMQLEEEGVFQTCHQELKDIDATTDDNAMMGIRMDAMGMGWIHDREHRVIWHNGGSGHFNSYLGFDPDSGTAVVILSNLPPSRRIPATVMGVKLMEELRDGSGQDR